MTITPRPSAERPDDLALVGAVIDSIPSAVVVVDETGRILLVNPPAEELCDYRCDELVGGAFATLLPERLRELHSKQSLGTAELFVLRKDGSEAPIELHSRTIDTADGVLVCHTLTDIAERKHAEVAQHLLNRELQEFSNAIAHDLRAPLRALNGFSQILIDEHLEKIDAEGRDCLIEIRDNAAKMNALIDGLLSIALVSRRELQSAWLELSSIVRASAVAAAARFAHSVDIVIADDLHAHVDAHLFRILIDSLLDNAFKFTSQATKARIEVGSCRKDGSTTFFVRDNGVGFDMGRVARLFVPFQRLHSASAYPGIGTGLAIVLRIVHRHCGRTWAEGVAGGGATFYFTLTGRIDS